MTPFRCRASWISYRSTTSPPIRTLSCHREAEARRHWPPNRRDTEMYGQNSMPPSHRVTEASRHNVVPPRGESMDALATEPLRTEMRSQAPSPRKQRVTEALGRTCSYLNVAGRDNSSPTDKDRSS